VAEIFKRSLNSNPAEFSQIFYQWTACLQERLLKSLKISSSKKNPLPLEFQKAASDIDMDIFWNHAFELQY